MAATVEPGQRLRQASARARRQLASELHRALPERRPGRAADVAGVLRAWRRLGMAEGLTAVDRLALRKRVVHVFARVLGSPPAFHPRDFGATSPDELAELLVQALERTGTLRVPRAKREGQRRRFAGELFELLVQHLQELHEDLLQLARGQLQLLNAGLGTLVDARGTSVSLEGRFGRVRRATELEIVDLRQPDQVTPGTPRRPPRKFVDLAYVSVFEHASGSGPRTLSFLVETEAKLATAASKAGRQIGRAQARFDMDPGDRLRLRLEGQDEPIEVEPAQIVFAPQAVNRILVTSRNQPQYELSATDRGGYPETYWRVGVVIRSAEIWRLARALIP